MKVKPANYPHITSNPKIANGVPVIAGTRITVRSVAGYYQLGMSVDEILQSLPYLMPARVHGALSFYFDHQKEIDRDIKQNNNFAYWRKQVKRRAVVAG